MNGIQIRIMNNLKNRVHGVADHIALSGIDDQMAGMEALIALQQKGLVDAEPVNIAEPGKPKVMRKLYTLSWTGRQADLGLRRIK